MLNRAKKEEKMAGTERQQEAITSHDTSVVVSAGAGTGKTYVLVNKYMDLLESFGWQNPDSINGISVLNILALTFTDKAAAEMKERIRSELEKREGAFWEKSRLEFLIAPVQTFHSFCASVLREFPFEAGLEPSFNVLDQEESSRIFSLSFQELIHTPAEEEIKDSLIRNLSVVGEYSLEKITRYLYSHREDAEEFFFQLDSNPDAVISRWQEEIQKFREQEVDNLRNNKKFSDMVISLLGFAAMDIPADDKAMIYLQDVKPFLESLLETDNPDKFLDAASSFLQESLKGGSKKNWSEDLLKELRETNKTLNELLKKDIEYIRKTEFIPENPFNILTLRFLADLNRTFSRFCTIIEKKKSDAGGIDFYDLIRYTKKLFRTNHDTVASYYKDRYRYILIDEFQDTDPAQFEIVNTIIGEPSPEVNSLFIVGDPKQSIYLFRDADVTRFRDAQNLITGACNGKNIPLDVCFRSSPEVVSFVNTLFSRLFHTAEKPWEFTYDFIQVSNERKNHEGSVTLILIQKDAEVPECEVISQHIETLIKEQTTVYEEGIRDEDGNRTFVERAAIYGDIAILLERRTHLGHFIHSLAIRNIPYYVHKGTGFYNRQEILDLISLISVLYRPYDDIHMVGLLRSPYFGLSDLEILQISRYAGSSFLEKIFNSSKEYPKFAQVYTHLTGWMQCSGRLRLVPLIRSVLIKSGVMAVYGGLVEGDQIISNIEKLLDIIRTKEEIGKYQLPDLVIDLYDALDREEEEGEAMIDDPDLDAVTVMTIHAAKGLEFPIVFIPEMTARPNLDQGPVLLGSSRSLMGVVLPDPENNLESTKTPIYRLLKKELDYKLLAEKKRLLYVALTRAADHLIMSGEIGEELPDGTHNTRLDWIIPTLGISDYDIGEGHILIQDADGRDISVRIITPDEDIRSIDPGVPPFIIPPELMECHGTFEKKVIKTQETSKIPYQVTQLAEHLSLPLIEIDHEYEGEGALFGSAVHEVLRGRDPDLVVKEFGILDEKQQEKLQTVLEEFLNQISIAEMSDVFREYAFTVSIAGIPLTGRIDLLFRRPDGTWRIIDYKSDALAVLQLSQKESYQFQLESYRRAAEILGMNPALSVLYSVSDKKLIELDPWPDEKYYSFLTTCVEQINVHKPG